MEYPSLAFEFLDTQSINPVKELWQVSFRIAGDVVHGLIQNKATDFPFAFMDFLLVRHIRFYLARRLLAFSHTS